MCCFTFGRSANDERCGEGQGDITTGWAEPSVLPLGPGGIVGVVYMRASVFAERPSSSYTTIRDMRTMKLCPGRLSAPHSY